MNNRPQSTLELWMSTRTAPAERLAKFRLWLVDEVENRIRWPQSKPQRVKEVYQAARFIEAFCRELAARGWLFDGPALVKHIRAQLDEIRAAQEAGRVQALWPFFKAVIDRYAGVRAEELAAEAISLRCHIGNIERNLLAAESLTIPELCAEDARQRALAGLRAKTKQPAKPVEKEQLLLFRKK